MTEEQLNKEAEEYADKHVGVKSKYSSAVDGFIYGKVYEAIKDGYRSRDKEVEEKDKELDALAKSKDYWYNEWYELNEKTRNEKSQSEGR